MKTDERICNATVIHKGRRTCVRQAFYRLIYVEPLEAPGLNECLVSHDVAVCDSPTHLKHLIDRAHGTVGVHSVMVYPL